MVTPTINQLPDLIANQIAAGEVVEQPANVVKELVENALDAGASQIHVHIEDGGRRLVQVTDNGHGMQPEDLRAALGRHATSKIAQADDLFRIGTLGFRGEALPSIASVSEMTLTSRPHDCDEASALHLAAGTIIKQERASLAPGTQMSVRNLFWNVPVRLKFLKNQAAETAQVTDMLTRLALGHPECGFELTAENRQIFSVPDQQSIQDRVGSLLGRDLASGLMPVHGRAESTELAGFVAHPSFAKPTSKRQYIYLNGRHLRDKLLIAAVREGFKGFLEPRQHGSVFLLLDTDPSLVDVNVHPTKSEVRFRREREIFALIKNSIQESLQSDPGSFPVLADQPSAGRRDIIKSAAPTVIEQERFLPVTLPGSNASAASPSQPSQLSQQALPSLGQTSDMVREHRPVYEETAPPSESNGSPTVQGSSLNSTQTATQLPQVHSIHQVHDMYLIVECDDGLHVIDQHALHEKALYLLLDPTTAPIFGGGTQELLIPLTIDLTPAEVAAVEAHLPALAEVGIVAEVFGPATLALHEHPTTVRKMSWPKFFSDIADIPAGEDPLANIREAVRQRTACRAAIKAGDRLTPEEQQELVRIYFASEDVHHCPHGRPTALKLSWYELEQRFAR